MTFIYSPLAWGFKAGIPDLSAYGLQFSLPTLNLVRYRIKPKARYEMRSVALFRQHFQLLVEVHFRGAPEDELYQQEPSFHKTL